MSDQSSKFELDDFNYIIGIDFGTTFSGCSYVYSRDSANDVDEIKEWPKQGSAIYPKVPTVLLYEKDTKKMLAWGYNAIHQSKLPNNDAILVKRFKLFLDSTIHNPTKLPNGLTPFEVISDYLSEFHKYILQVLKRSLGKVYDPSKFRYCLTIPAMWSDQAKSTMREAAIKANIIKRSDHPDRLILTSEPEAAAIYCEKKSNQFKLTDGQRFMICDAGGGTVDLIVFEINDVDGTRTLREVTTGSGSSCGSSFLDQRMRSFIRKRFGQFAKKNESVIEDLLSQFISGTKPGFEDEDDEYLILSAEADFGDQDLSKFGIVDGNFYISVDELRQEIFNPIVNQVVNLIRGQIDQSKTFVDAIFLVGGFGQSKYLYKAIKEAFKDKVGFIALPSRGELAVVRGAVMFGMQPRVVTHRIARRTYGLKAFLPFDPLLDPEHLKVTMPNGCVQSSDRFAVYINKGDSVMVDKCVSKTFWTFPPIKLSPDLYAYNEDGVPPRHITDPKIRMVSAFPIQIDDHVASDSTESIKLLVKMYFGLTEIRMEVVIKGRVFLLMSAYDTHETQPAPDLPNDKKQSAKALKPNGGRWNKEDNRKQPASPILRVFNSNETRNSETQASEGSQEGSLENRANKGKNKAKPRRKRKGPPFPKVQNEK
ncbi:hypothetical protein CLU79DRAFT_779899 [Phycomyces nitens]|nr:hypothetical protein CLU79DRAFT_779899 [Phycomyces nitens]